MKLVFNFKNGDFDNLKNFDNAIKRQINIDFTTNYNVLSLHFDYPKDLIEMLRPFPKKEIYNFNIKGLELSFQKSDFKSFYTFQDAVKRNIGQYCYVGTDSMSAFFYYSETLYRQLKNPQTFDLECVELNNN